MTGSPSDLTYDAMVRKEIELLRADKVTLLAALKGIKNQAFPRAGMVNGRTREWVMSVEAMEAICAAIAKAEGRS